MRNEALMLIGIFSIFILGMIAEFCLFAQTCGF